MERKPTIENVDFFYRLGSFALMLESLLWTLFEDLSTG